MRNVNPISSGRPGYTLVELIISMGAATMLMAGMASTLFISSQAMNGVGVVEERRDAAEVQADMLQDFAQAELFTTRTATAATFTVPDRDGDSNDETISYNWTGAPNYELQYSCNGGATVPLLTDVQSFNLGYSSRFIIGGAAPPPAMNPSLWGNRWISGGNFGHEDIFASADNDRRRQLATRVTLDADQTIVSITAYLDFPFGGNSDVTYAIYSFKKNSPDILITSSSVVTANSTGWFTLSVAPTALVAGEYYLALCAKSDDLNFRYESSGGETHTQNRDATKIGWSSSFSSHAGNSRKLSIYATYE